NNQRIVLIAGLAAAIVVIGLLSLLLLRRKPVIGENEYRQQTAPPPASQTGDLKPSLTQTPRLTTEELFKQAAQSVVLIQVFNSSGTQFGTGSGFIVADGGVVTNYHVIRGAYSATARLQDGSTNPIQGAMASDPNR